MNIGSELAVASRGRGLASISLWNLWSTAVVLCSGVGCCFACSNSTSNRRLSSAALVSLDFVCALPSAAHTDERGRAAGRQQLRIFANEAQQRYVCYDQR